MRFNDRSEVATRHAFLSPSQSAWLRYDDQKLLAKLTSFRAATRGTDLHALAHEAIRLKIYLADTHSSLSEYVYDAIQFGMVCEQPLFYSPNCFGTPDTISFSENVLRIHDLKTGIIPAKFEQLLVYAALFCLEYSIDPYAIDVVLRIYQGEGAKEFIPEPDEVSHVMDRIVYADNIILAYEEDM